MKFHGLFCLGKHLFAAGYFSIFATVKRFSDAKHWETTGALAPSVMQKKQKAVLLVNVGTPDKAEVKDVRRFLSQFLNDKYVMDMPRLLRKILVNLVIVPFRAPKSTKLYRQLWTAEGSPLLFHSGNFAAGLQNKLGKDFQVFTAMRYGNPSLGRRLWQIKSLGFDELVVFPLFPQYASSTTGTVMEFVKKEVHRGNLFRQVHFISQFYDHPGFLEAFAQNIAACHPEAFDHVIFSYHGLPLRQVNKIHPEVRSGECPCDRYMPAHGTNCYKATCYETTRLLAGKLGLEASQYSVGFQSRFSNRWLSPFTDELIKNLAAKGAKKILVTVPSFVADCLETLVEIEIGYGKLFEDLGGEKLVLVKGLNSNEQWTGAAADIVQKQLISNSGL